MLCLARRFVVSFALAAAAIAPALPTHAAPLVRDNQDRPCTLISKFNSGHKSSPYQNVYVCAGVTYSVFDPHLNRRVAGHSAVDTANKPCPTRALTRASAPHDPFAATTTSCAS